MEINNFQRVGSTSNTQVGIDFEQVARNFFASQGVHLTRNYKVDVGVGALKKPRSFDLGSDDPAILVECKSHAWTAGDNVPSAKMTVWTEAMYFFHISPARYRKVLFSLKSLRRGNRMSLATYYANRCPHLIPPGVEIWEWSVEDGVATRVT